MTAAILLLLVCGGILSCWRWRVLANHRRAQAAWGEARGRARLRDLHGCTWLPGCQCRVCDDVRANEEGR
jgi:hypothetical protein